LEALILPDLSGSLDGHVPLISPNHQWRHHHGANRRDGPVSLDHRDRRTNGSSGAGVGNADGVPFGCSIG